MSWYSAYAPRVISQSWAGSDQDTSYVTAMAADLQALRDAVAASSGVNVPLTHQSVKPLQAPYNYTTDQLAEEINSCLAQGNGKTMATNSKAVVNDDQDPDDNTPALQVNANKNSAASGQGIAVDTVGQIFENGVHIGAGSGGNVPIGGIILWNDTLASLPASWSLFLAIEDRFAIGAGGTYALGDTGGTDTHNHTGMTGANNASVTVDTSGLSVSGSGTTSNTNISVALAGNTNNTQPTLTGSTDNASPTGSLTGTTGNATTGLTMGAISHFHAVGNQAGASVTNVSNNTTNPGFVSAYTGLPVDTNSTSITPTYTEPNAGAGHSHSLTGASITLTAHAHTISNTNLTVSNHNHAVSLSGSNNHNHAFSFSGASVSGVATGNTNHLHTISDEVLLPPFYSLYYVQRIS